MAMAAMRSISRRTGDDDAAARRAEREADADLAGALLGGVGEDAVESDGGENEGEDGEAYGEDGECAFAKGGELGLGFHGAEAADDESGIEVVHRFADRGFAGFGRLRGLDVELHAVGVLHLCVGTVDGGAKFCAEIGVTDVADDSDDCGIGFGVGDLCLRR